MEKHEAGLPAAVALASDEVCSSLLDHGRHCYAAGRKPKEGTLLLYPVLPGLESLIQAV